MEQKMESEMERGEDSDFRFYAAWGVFVSGGSSVGVEMF